MFDASNGIDFIEWGILAAALSAILTCFYLVWDRGVRPVVKAAKGFNQRWDDAGEITIMKADLALLVAAIKPTNGDPRTLSQRVDAAVHAAEQALEISQATANSSDKYQFDEKLERQQRMAEAHEERRALNKRMESVEGRQNDLSTRQTAMSATLTEILKVLRGEDG